MIIGCLFSGIDADARADIGRVLRAIPIPAQLYRSKQPATVSLTACPCRSRVAQAMRDGDIRLLRPKHEMPRISVACMLSLWGATVDLIANRQYPDIRPTCYDARRRASRCVAVRISMMPVTRTKKPLSDVRRSIRECVECRRHAPMERPSGNLLWMRKARTG